MNDKVIQGVTKALDSAITNVANEEFNRLSAGLGRQEIANKIRCALHSLDRLRIGRMPNYDDWDALFYSLWYEPGQINLAYTLTRLLPEEISPLKNRMCNLQVVDFGCGALAMQFGLALAAADALEERGTVPSIAIVSQDESEPMKDIGRNIWQCFIEEIAKYPGLNSLQEVCKVMNFDDQGDPEAVCWLTAIHVAYRENAREVRTALTDRICEHKPAVVLATSHPQSAQSAFSPTDHGYTVKCEVVISREKLILGGEFRATTNFRASLHNNHIMGMVHFLGEDNWFVRRYLRSYPTAWVTTRDFRARSVLYIRG